MCSLIVVQGEAQLLQVVLAPRAAGRLAGGLHGRQEQRHQNADDGDYHQQFDERKAAPERKLAHDWWEGKGGRRKVSAIYAHAYVSTTKKLGGRNPASEPVLTYVRCSHATAAPTHGDCQN